MLCKGCLAASHIRLRCLAVCHITPKLRQGDIAVDHIKVVLSHERRADGLIHREKLVEHALACMGA